VHTEKKAERVLSFRHLLDARQLLPADMDALFDLAAFFQRAHAEGRRAHDEARGRILAALFYEPSTRTRFSFEAAMYRLGGQVIGTESGDGSSLRKGETPEDTGIVLSGYADVVAIRHPEEGSAARLARHASVPVVNAGDGGNEHPTQTLTDLYHLLKEKGTLQGLTVGFYGDLRYSRTAFPLIRHLAGFGCEIVLIAPEGLDVPDERLASLDPSACVRRAASLGQEIARLDALYVTRLQKERFDDPRAYERLQGSYAVTPTSLEKAKADMIVMHPLPRTSEIPVAIDVLPAASYFRQAQRGLFVRMALLALLLKA
jgi:aspartate carbamoyltransferase catalytic subunit